MVQGVVKQKVKTEPKKYVSLEIALPLPGPRLILHAQGRKAYWTSDW